MSQGKTVSYHHPLGYKVEIRDTESKPRRLLIMAPTEGFCSRCGSVMRVEQKYCPKCKQKFYGSVDLQEEFDVLRSASDGALSDLDREETEHFRDLAIRIVNGCLALVGAIILFLVCVVISHGFGG